MDRDTVIALAREARLVAQAHPLHPWGATDADLARFAALVAAAEREEVRRLYRENQFLKHDLYDCAKACEQIAAAEREECAKVCDLVAREIDDTNGTATYCAAAIRSKTNPVK